MLTKRICCSDLCYKYWINYDLQYNIVLYCINNVIWLIILMFILYCHTILYYVTYYFWCAFQDWFFYSFSEITVEIRTSLKEWWFLRIARKLFTASLCIPDKITIDQVTVRFWNCFPSIRKDNYRIMWNMYYEESILINFLNTSLKHNIRIMIHCNL